jgi:hypothetical protein
MVATHDAHRDRAISNMPHHMRAKMKDNFHPPLMPVVQLYKLLLAAGVRPLILTGRYERHRDETFDNLRCIGVDTWDDAVFRAAHEETMSAQEYKEKRRADWARDGYNIIASVGDQESDVVGEHVGVPVLLPNPAYKIH